MGQDEIKNGKTAAIVAYLTLVGCLIAITMNLESKNSFARFHIRQAFGTHISFHGLALFLSYAAIPYAWVTLYTFYLILWGYGFWAALTNKAKMIPIFGPYFQKWFTFIQ